MSAFKHGEGVAIERIQLRRIGPLVGFVSVRLPSAHLSGMKVEERADGRLTCTPPETVGRDGRRWASWALQPGWREAVERGVAVLWARSA